MCIPQTTMYVSTNHWYSFVDLKLKTEDWIYSIEESTIDLMFTYNVSLDPYHSVDVDKFEFKLRITNVSTTDMGNYTCSVFLSIEITIAGKYFCL